MTKKSDFKSHNKMENFPIKIWNVPGGLDQYPAFCGFWDLEKMRYGNLT